MFTLATTLLLVFTIAAFALAHWARKQEEREKILYGYTGPLIQEEKDTLSSR